MSSLTVLEIPVLLTQAPASPDTGSDEKYDQPEKVDSISNSGLDSENELRNRKPSVLISSLSKDEPIVTRKELWSYYSVYFMFPMDHLFIY
jgi:hypothetical protein